MKKLFISLTLVCIIGIQLSYQQQTFKPQRQTTGPYGRAAGTAFNFGMDTDSFNTLPSQVQVSSGPGGLHSISFTYPQQIGPTTRTGGTPAGTTSVADVGRIIRAQVCTGRMSGVVVIIGLRFFYESGMTDYWSGDASSVTNFRCIEATPATPGYYLQSLSGRYGTYINQLRLYWVSNFAQEQACYQDPNCQQNLNYCPSDFCCYSKEQDPDGQWTNGGLCA